MIFQHTIAQVLDGSKTQTRRLALPDSNGTGEQPCEMIGWPNGIKSVQRLDDMHNLWITKWQVGKTYAIQPGRGKKAVGRIRITDIRRECVQDISEDDARAEGIEYSIEVNTVGSLATQIEFGFTIGRRRDVYAELWDTIHTKPGTRWVDNPEVFVLTFELVEPTS